MKIGLYFGSFNPIHIGHLIIASYLSDYTELDQIWFMVSPQNPFKKAAGLLNEQHRFSLLQIALEGETKLKAKNMEFKLPKPSYTIDTLTYLSENYPQHDYSVIMGSDGYQNIIKWKNFEQIISNYNIYIYPRPSFPVTSLLTERSVIVPAPLLDISSTRIRKNIRERKSIRYLVTDDVLREIIAQNYYGATSENPT